MTKVLTHKWERLGYKAPFRALGMVSLPSPSLAEQNPAAYMNAMREAGRCGVPLGSCDVCGQGIIHNVIVEDADKRKFVVGCDCAGKIGDTRLEKQAKVLDRERQRKLREEKREAARVARLDAQRERNGGLTDSEVYHKRLAAEREAERARIQPIIEMLSPVADLIADGKGGFCDSIAATLRSGQTPYGKGHHLTCDIIAKQVGRRGSKDYDAEYERIETILEQAAAQ